MVTSQFEMFLYALDQCSWYLYPIEMQKKFMVLVVSAQQMTIIRSYGNVLCARESFKSVFSLINWILMSASWVEKKVLNDPLGLVFESKIFFSTQIADISDFFWVSFSGGAVSYHFYSVMSDWFLLFYDASSTRWVKHTLKWYWRMQNLWDITNRLYIVVKCETNEDVLKTLSEVK